MKFTGISDSFIYITAMFLCMELCYCIWIDRALQDKFDVFKGPECTIPQDGRCTCLTVDGTLASHIDNSEIKCLESGDFSDGMK